MAKFHEVVRQHKKESQKGRLIPVRITMTIDAYIDDVIDEKGTPAIRFQLSDSRFREVVYDDWSAIYVTLRESDVERIELKIV